jgi:hypothetical protein
VSCQETELNRWCGRLVSEIHATTSARKSSPQPSGLANHQPDGSFSSSNAIISVIGTNLNLVRKEVRGLDCAAADALPPGNNDRPTTTLALNPFLAWDLRRMPGSARADFVGYFVDISSDGFPPGGIPRSKGNLGFDDKSSGAWF